MSNTTENEAFSIRIVTADYYLRPPIPQLDVTFSEFRGSEVKQLPILRIFGATPTGHKTCLHIHGVFPYLYIPCEDPKPEPKTAYQIANSIDKALNISLKQAHSNVQHVYKVILVQGIPFYGFHTKVHQFYKIFFYNPLFIKRVADLLQYGAILGLTYQPHEAHVNFTMQFFLDFNLYGMSFLNLEHVKYRRKLSDFSNSNQNISNIGEELYLPESIEFTSCCEFEVDCLAQHILNRKDVIHGNLGANPGLQALWEDEKQRLKDMNMSETLLPTPTQIRDNTTNTDSHHLYVRKLLIKLALNSEILNESSDNTTLSILNDTPNKVPTLESTLNVTKEKCSVLLSKMVYPAETPEDSDTLNATNVMLHHPSSISNDLKETCDSKSFENDSSFIIDETIILQCSQRQPLSQVKLDSEDMDLMDMLRDMEQHVEDDSILGTQIQNNIQEDPNEDENLNEPENFDKLLLQDIDSSKDVSEKSTKENTNTFSQSLWNDTFWDNVENISQLDGAWDYEDENSGSKMKSKRKLKVGLSKPRKKHKANNISQRDSSNVTPENSSVQSPKKCSDTESKFDQLFNEFPSHRVSPKKSPRKTSRNIIPLDVSFQGSPKSNIVNINISNKRALRNTPCNILKEEKLLNSSSSYNSKKLSQKITHSQSLILKEELKSPNQNILPSLSKNLMSNKMEKGNIINNNHNDTVADKITYSKTNEEISDPKNTEMTLLNYNLSPKFNGSKQVKKTLTSSQYDAQLNYVPQPGTSTVIKEDKINSNDDINLSSSLYDTQNDEKDLGVISFYNTTLYQDMSITDDINSNQNDKSNANHSEISIKLHYDTSSDSDNDTLNLENNKINILMNENRPVVLIPKNPAPSFDDIFSTMKDYNIPYCRNKEPYYSDYNDVGHQIELCQVILKLKSKNLPDIKPFHSDVTNCDSIEIWREKVFVQNNITQGGEEIKDLTPLLTSNRDCILTPLISPPTVDSVKSWLKQRADKKMQSEKSEEPVELNIDRTIYCIPSSPGQDLNASQIETFSLSPYSPLSILATSKICDAIPSPDVSIKSEVDSEKKIIISTAKKKWSLTQPIRKLRPRSLRLSLQTTRNSIDSNSAPEDKLSQKSSDSDVITCGQSSILDCLTVAEDIETNVDPCIKSQASPEHIKDIAKSTEPIQCTVNPSTSFGFKFSGENYQDIMTTHEYEYLTIMVLEILTSVRGDMYPDPEIDPILAAFYYIKNDCPLDHHLPQKESGLIIVKEDQFNAEHSKPFLEGLNKKHNIILVDDERKLFSEVIQLVSKWDPDILCGYEIEMLSWGYLLQRGFILDMDMSSKISRVSTCDKSQSWKKESQETNREIKLIGRITLNVWRLLRHEIALTSYTFENIMYHVMHERTPHFSYKTLYFWWNHPSGLLRTLTMEYYLTRVIGIVKILEYLDLIGRTSELARLFGIQWYEVLSRGSQFRVESMMIRMTRPRNYVLVSPSVQQRAAMKAPECLPLIMEPESRFYSDPVIVLDFQSLYPSMMIAYNYCFSTCLGKVNNMGRDTPYEFGCNQLKISPRLLEKLQNKDLINWSPCGVGFVKPEVRKGVLPTMLQSILNTRLMIKKAMKKHKDNKTLQKILHSRQLGLKLIANVTYGYTAANFSGRMPCIEVGDSVVAKGRETLERAIKMVENTPRWGAKVVYGDTDSLFVLIPGRSRADAFDIGAEIAEAVTNDNPTPVKLKLEKIFQPCILQTKKRYVGYMYESKDQENPEYLAKGIETVRRDGCPASAKILEKSLRILFDSYDMSKVKLFVCREFQKIIEGKCNIKDFIFAKEFRGMHSYKPGASVPALEIARQLRDQDPRKEPRESERVPYVIVSGAPGETLLRLARHPRALLQDTRLRLNSFYYISKAIIPPLNRCLTLLGVDVNLWFADLPRKQVQLYPIIDECGKETESKKSTISQYFAKINCPGCEVQTTQGVCENCTQNPQKTMLVLQNKINNWQRRHNTLKKICQSCCGRGTNIECTSIDCPVLFSMSSAQQDVEQVPFLNKMKLKIIDF